MLVPIKKIKPSPKPVRTSWDEEAMERLKESIAKQGLIIPIKVRPMNGEYEVVYGHRRLEAMRRLGWKECEAIVEGMEPQMALVQSIVENVEREDLNDVDLGEALKAYREMMGYTSWEQVANDFGHTDIWAHERVTLTRRPTEIKQLVRAGKITAKHVMEAEMGIRKILPGGLSDEQAEEIEIATLKKVADEDLSKTAARRIAEVLATTEDTEVRKKALEREYFPGWDRYVETMETAGETEAEISRTALYWDFWPEAKLFLEVLRTFKQRIDDARKSVEIGKFSPEAKQFFVQRIQEMINLLMEFKEELGA